MSENKIPAGAKDGAETSGPEDLEKFRLLMTRENVMRKVEKDGYFAFRYRLLFDGQPRYVALKAVRVEEENGPVLVISVNDIDVQIRHEQEYERQLSSARSKANLDMLTGVKNRSAYESMSENLTRQIESGQTVRYAIVICHVHGVGWINETQGRDAGNGLIREACAMICETFRHSPVFRVAGDKFAVIALGHDYENIDELVAELEIKNHTDGETGDLLIACGMAKYDGTSSVAAVFHRAETICAGK